MADHTLGTIRGTIQIDYDGAGVVRGINDTNKFKNTAGKAADSVLSSFAKFGKGAATVGGAIASLNGVTAVLVGTAAALGPAVAAGFAAAPALIGGYIAVMGVAKIATAGVGDALSAAGGDAKEFNKAIKELSPEAQGFAKSFRTSLPVLQKVQDAMQDAFFKGTAGQVGGVVKAVASLKPEAVGISGSLGDIAQNIVKTVTSGKGISALRGILSGVNDFLKQIKGSIGPVVAGFLGVSQQGASFGKVLGTVVAGGLAKLASWLSSIDVGQVFRDAVAPIRAMAGFLAQVATIASNVFSVFTGDGASALGVIGGLVSGMASFLKSAQGQATLAALRDAFAAIGGAVGQVFLALLKAVGPIIVALAPGFAALATQVAGVLVPAINALAPLLASLAGFISDNIGVIGPLAGIIGAAAVAYKLYAAGAAGVAAVQAVLNSSMALNTAAWVRNTAATVANKAAQLVSAAVTGGAAVAAWVANTAVIVANRVAMAASAIAMAVVRGAVIAWTAVQWALNAALSANPIGLIVIAIIALVAGLIYAYQNSETFRAIVQATWAAIKVAISAVVNWITGTVWPSLQRAWQQISDGATALWGLIKAAWDGIKSAVSTAINAVSSVISSVWSAIVSVVTAHVNAMRTAVTTVFNFVRSTITSVMNAIRSVVRSVWAAIVGVVRTHIAQIKSVIAQVSSVIATVRNAFNRAKTAIQTALASALTVVRGFPGRVLSGLGNLGSLLYSKGQALIEGFISGIKNMAGKAAAAAKSVVSAVTDFFPGSPAKKGPLSGRGYVLKRAQRFMADFNKGLNDGRAAPVRSIQGMIGRIGVALPGRPTPTKPQPIIRQTITTQPKATAIAGGGTRTYNINIGDKRFATLTLDVISGNPVAVAKAANEGNRKTAWSGSGRLTAPVKSKTGKK